MSYSRTNLIWKTSLSNNSRLKKMLLIRTGKRNSKKQLKRHVKRNKIRQKLSKIKLRKTMRVK